MATPVKGDSDYVLYRSWLWFQSDATAPRVTWDAFKANWCGKNPDKCQGGQVMAGAKVGSAVTAAATVIAKKATANLTQPLTATGQAAGAPVVGRTWADLAAQSLDRYAKYLPWVGALAIAGVGAWWLKGRKGAATAAANKGG